MIAQNANKLNVDIDEAKKLDPIKANDLRFKKVFMELEIEQLSNEEKSQLHILDMGCGNGDFLHYCKNIGIHAVGITISPEQCHLLKQQNLEVYDNLFESLKFLKFFIQI